MADDRLVAELSPEEERRRYEMTLEALKDVDEGRTISHDEVLARVAARKLARRAKPAS